MRSTQRSDVNLTCFLKCKRVCRAVLLCFIGTPTRDRWVCLMPAPDLASTIGFLPDYCFLKAILLCRLSACGSKSRAHASLPLQQTALYGLLAIAASWLI